MVMLVIIPLIVQVSGGRSHFFEIDSDILEAVLSLCW
jgi:hypothetical protein